MKTGPAVILGGAGFVGANLASRLLSQGTAVRIFDNLSRTGVERNVEWLRNVYDGRLELCTGDVRDERTLRSAIAHASEVFHLAAQVALTKSISDPALDFDVNARGTLNVLEILREQRDPPLLVYTSTHKVYGPLDHLPLREGPKRYTPATDLFAEGISETQRLDLRAPYGCSKGAADQYVLDYARTFGLPAIVLRMSSVYGPRQYGSEDQGWVAHFVKRSLRGEPITIYGNGKQVRDLLFIDDLLDALSSARREWPKLVGQAFNIGGGAGNTSSLLELVDAIEELGGEKPAVTFSDERPSDQRYYVSDVRRFGSRTGWAPRTDVRQGLGELYLWLSLPYEKRRTRQAAAETRP